MTYAEMIYSEILATLDDDGRDYEGERDQAQRDHEEDMAAREPWL